VKQNKKLVYHSPKPCVGVASRPIVPDAEGYEALSGEVEKGIRDPTLGGVRVLLRRLACFAWNTLNKQQKDFLRQFPAIRLDNQPNATRKSWGYQKSFLGKGRGASTVAAA
jgi:hypothetical protein